MIWRDIKLKEKVKQSFKKIYMKLTSNFTLYLHIMIANLKNYTKDILNEIEISLNIVKNYGLYNLGDIKFFHLISSKNK